MDKYLPTDLIKIASRTGRWWIKQVNELPALYTTNLGSYLRLQASGVSKFTLNVIPTQNIISPSQVYAIRIDDQQWQRYPATTQQITVLLTPKKHTITVMAAGNTDADQVWAGNEGFAIQSLTVDHGHLAAAPLRHPVIDFIGDSITAGCWVNGAHAAADYRPETNYAATCADLLNVDSVRIAYSAGGVLREATGGVPTADKFLAKMDQDTRWTPNHPDLVIINLGVNDRRFPEKKFATAYDLFIQQVIATFPATTIMVMIPFSQTYAATIRTIAGRYQLTVIETVGWCQSFTDGLHPDQTGATTAGQHLAKFLHSAFE